MTGAPVAQGTITSDQLAGLTLRQAYDLVVLGNPEVQAALDAVAKWEGKPFDPGEWLREGRRARNKHPRISGWQIRGDVHQSSESLVQHWYRNAPLNIPDILPECMMILADVTLKSMQFIVTMLVSGEAMSTAIDKEGTKQIDPNYYQLSGIRLYFYSNLIYRRDNHGNDVLEFEGVSLTVPKSDKASATAKSKGGRPKDERWPELITRLLIHLHTGGEFKNKTRCVEWMMNESKTLISGSDEFGKSTIEDHLKKHHMAFYNSLADE